MENYLSMRETELHDGGRKKILRDGAEVRRFPEELSQLFLKTSWSQRQNDDHD